MKHFAMVLCLASLASLPAVEQAQAIDIEDLDEGDARKKAKKS
jgi:hypothetical protein